MRIVLVHTFRQRPGATSQASSDSIGYGWTAADALVSCLRRLGAEVDIVSPEGLPQPEWYSAVLARFVVAVRRRRPDVVLSFHSMNPQSSVLRQILDDISPSTRLVAYTHGSHWDPSDVYRQETNPRLKWADLGSLLCLDALLVVSELVCDTLSQSITSGAPDAWRELADRVAVVGLPLDLPAIDQVRPPGKREFDSPRLLFNHSFSAGKRPSTFLDVAERLLSEAPKLSIDITRRPPPGALADRVNLLACREPGRVRLHDDLGIEAYQRLLWTTTHQISVASHETLGVATLEAMYSENCCMAPDHAAYQITFAATPEALFAPDNALGMARDLLSKPRQSAALARRQRLSAGALADPLLVAQKVLEALQ